MFLGTWEHAEDQVSALPAPLNVAQIWLNMVLLLDPDAVPCTNWLETRECTIRTNYPLKQWFSAHYVEIEFYFSHERSDIPMK